MKVAVIEKVSEAGSSIVAFSNLWLPEPRKEFSVDLMRYSEDAPKDVMEFLFTELMLWGKEQGYQNMNLGMAPLSGLETHSLASMWHNLGTFLFRHGEHFYNFQGLRTYKEKFDPNWSPRYLASPGGFALAKVLRDLTVLVSGGVRGIFAKK